MSWTGTFPPVTNSQSLPGVRLFTFQALPSGAITMAQLKRGLKTQPTPVGGINPLQAVHDAVSADITSEANIEWTSAQTVVQGDELATFILNTLSAAPYYWTQATMNTLFAVAATMQP